MGFEVYKMKLFYDKKAKDPTYYAQQGIRIEQKTTTRNVKNFGKHSELLKITDDPLAYVKEEIRKMNEEYRVGRVAYDCKVDFNEKDFFSKATSDRKIQFDPYTILRFMTYARILDPGSKLHAWECLDHYYEKPSFDNTLSLYGNAFSLSLKKKNFLIIVIRYAIDQWIVPF